MATADSVQENQTKSSDGDPLSYILSGAASGINICNILRV